MNTTGKRGLTSWREEKDFGFRNRMKSCRDIELENKFYVKSKGTTNDFFQETKLALIMNKPIRNQTGGGDKEKLIARCYKTLIGHSK